MINIEENQENNQENSKDNPSDLENMFKSGSTALSNSRESFYCISIIGQIEGHYLLNNNQKATKYDHLIPLLVSLEESENIDGVLIILNTMGGDVEAGLAISELISSMSKPTVSLVLGGGHSIGVPLAVSADRSFIVPSATMTIHPVRTSGLVIGVPQAFDYLQKMQDRIISFITSHSRVKEDYLRKLMSETEQMANDIGSVIDGKEAVECGLIDQVGGISDALCALRELTRK
ncbi:MAG: ATP-dependent Clp protease proteolytic subunit [Clostridia bacterium]|jgi:ATP-dependent protease ClpP protease subunit|nr:ATP-dependent Clp protease proteolytic subunit [Clostridia bacterium]